MVDLGQAELFAFYTETNIASTGVLGVNAFIGEEFAGNYVISITLTDEDGYSSSHLTIIQVVAPITVEDEEVSLNGTYTPSGNFSWTPPDQEVQEDAV